MKFFFGIVLFVASLGTGLTEIRKNFVLASETKEMAEKLSNSLEEITKDSKPILIAYKGAALTLRAKYSKGIKQKKSFFKEGVSYLELAIEKAPNNIEVKCLRLSVQEHSPKILKYKKNIEEDKEFVKDNYKKTTNKAVKQFVKNYVLQSTLFNAAEKKLF